MLSQEAVSAMQLLSQSSQEEILSFIRILKFCFLRDPCKVDCLSLGSSRQSWSQVIIAGSLFRKWFQEPRNGGWREWTGKGFQTVQKKKKKKNYSPIGHSWGQLGLPSSRPFRKALENLLPELATWAIENSIYSYLLLIGQECSFSCTQAADVLLPSSGMFHHTCGVINEKKMSQSQRWKFWGCYGARYTC